jgi:hypothetical protein
MLEEIWKKKGKTSFYLGLFWNNFFVDLWRLLSNDFMLAFKFFY